MSVVMLVVGDLVALVVGDVVGLVVMIYLELYSKPPGRTFEVDQTKPYNQSLTYVFCTVFFGEVKNCSTQTLLSVISVRVKLSSLGGVYCSW